MKIARSKNFEVNFYNQAVGVGNYDFNITNNSGLNSALEFHEKYKYPPGDEEILSLKSINLESIQLNKVLKLIGNNYERIRVLKIDVQGLEHEILLSGDELKTGLVDFLIIEIMLVQKYKYQKSYLEILDLLADYGFIICEIKQVFKELNNNLVTNLDFVQISEIDVLFVHKSSISKLEISLYDNSFIS